MKFSNNIVSSTKNAYQNWREPEHVHTLARLYWHLMLGVSVCIVIGMVTYGALNLSWINDDSSPSQSATPAAASALNKKALTKLLTNLEHRQTTFENLKASSSTIADPSK